MLIVRRYLMFISLFGIITVIKVELLAADVLQNRNNLRFVNGRGYCMI
jgi:hypothetical protein